jgi:methionine synthase I (cobalamin-dependent)
MDGEGHLHTYLQAARQWVADDVQIVGGCCGTTPAYIRALRQLLEKQA